MNIFDSLTKYAGKWSVKSTRDFTEDEIAAVTKAEVVTSSYGLSVCFYLNGGGQSYIPLDTNSTLAAGAIVDVKSAKLMTLGKDGENDITRVTF